MDKDNKFNEKQGIWNTLNDHERQLKRVDKNTFILFVIVIIALIVAVIK